MNCIKCGAEIYAGDYSCSSCGMILSNSPMARLQMMMEQDKELKQKMDEYSANNVIEATKTEVEEKEVPSIATPVGEFPSRQGPLITKEATMVTDLSNSTIFNPEDRKESLWDE